MLNKSSTYIVVLVCIFLFFINTNKLKSSWSWEFNFSYEYNGDLIEVHNAYWNGQLVGWLVRNVTQKTMTWHQNMAKISISSDKESFENILINYNNNYLNINNYFFEEPSKLIVYDLSGKIIYEDFVTKESTQFRIPQNDMQSKLILIYIHNSNFTVTRKLLIQNEGQK